VIKTLALILVAAMVAILAWALFMGTSAVTITLNGRQITSPFGAIISMWGLILTLVILFCVAILLAFVFAGVGLIVFGCLVLVGVILAAIAFPFLLPMLVPLFIVWLVCSLASRTKAA
jgi:hypothetical protein